MGKKITCTRCLGKGFIDKKDIKRLSRGLNRVSEWEENSDCRFCNGEGKITEKFASKHNPDSGEFPNVVDYSGLINFMKLTEEEKNDRFKEAWKRVNGKEWDADDNEETDINFDEAENNYLEKESKTSNQAESIFWGSVLFFFVLVQLFIPIYQHKKFIDYYESWDGLFSFPLVIIIFFFPTLFLHSLLFGKSEITNNQKEKESNTFLYINLPFYLSVMIWIIGIITGIMTLINRQFLEEFHQHPIMIGVTGVLSILIGRFFEKKTFILN